MVNDCGFLEKKGECFFFGGGRGEEDLNLEEICKQLCGTLLCELITCSKLPSKWSLFGTVKFHLCSKNSESDREG